MTKNSYGPFSDASLSNTGIRRACAALALTLCAAGSGWAQSDVPSSMSNSAKTQIEVTPYVWGMHINTDDQFGSTSANANLPLSKILRSLKGLGEVEGVVKQKAFFVSSDAIYADLNVDSSIPVPNLNKIQLQAAFIAFVGGIFLGPYHVSGEGKRATYMSFQPFGGSAYTDIAITAKSVTGPNLFRVAQEWWMPTAGARINAQRGQYVLRLDGDFSEFRNGQNGEQALGAVGYQPNKPRAGSPIFQLGYRYLYEKKQPNAEEALRLKLQGPVFFVTFHVK